MPPTSFHARRCQLISNSVCCWPGPGAGRSTGLSAAVRSPYRTCQNRFVLRVRRSWCFIGSSKQVQSSQSLPIRLCSCSGNSVIVGSRRYPWPHKEPSCRRLSNVTLRDVTQAARITRALVMANLLQHQSSMFDPSVTDSAPILIVDDEKDLVRYLRAHTATKGIPGDFSP